MWYMFFLACDMHTHATMEVAKRIYVMYNMIIRCSNCSTKFKVPNSAIGTAGRLVHCTRCDAEWWFELSDTNNNRDTQKACNTVVSDTVVSDIAVSADIEGAKSGQQVKIERYPAYVATIAFILCIGIIVIVWSKFRTDINLAAIYTDLRRLYNSEKWDVIATKNEKSSLLRNILAIDEFAIDGIDDHSNNTGRKILLTISNKSEKMQIINTTTISGYDKTGNRTMLIVDTIHQILYPYRSLNLHIQLKNQQEIKQLQNLHVVKIAVNDMLIAEKIIEANEQM